MQKVGTFSSARTHRDINKVVHGISLPILQYSSLRKCIRVSFPLSLIFLGSGLCPLSDILNMACCFRNCISFLMKNIAKLTSCNDEDMFLIALTH